MNLQMRRRSAAAAAAAVVLGLGAAACTSNIPEADRAVPAPPGLVQFRGDFDTGDTSQWELETAEDYSLTVVDGGPGHPTAGRFEVRDGDTPVDSGERSEVRSEDRFDVADGDERWYSFSLKFDNGFSNPGGWCIPMQWHGADEDGDASDGSPQLNLECSEDGNLYLKVGDKTELLIGPLDPGVWHSYVIHVKFSNDPKVAFEEVTRDGQVVIPKTSPKRANMDTPRAYYKLGLYRDPEISGTMVVWFDDVTVSVPAE